MEKGCICHFCGYEIKDAKARAKIAELEQLENGNRDAIMEESGARELAIQQEAAARELAIQQEAAARELAIQQEAAARELAIRSTKNRKFLIIGDSYTAGSQLAEGQKTWVDWFREFLGLSDDSCRVFSYGGASFGIASDSEYAFKTVLQTAVDAMTEEDRNGITDLIVFGGANDWSHTETEITAGMMAFTTLSGTAFPNAKKWLFCAGWTFNTEYRAGLKYAYLYYSRNAGKYGFTVFNETFRAIHNKNRMSNDEVHPNADGQLELGRVAVNCIQGGSTHTLPPVEHAVMLNNLKIGTAIDNGYCVDVHLFCQTMEITSVDITGDFAKIATLSSDVLLGSDANDKQTGTFTANVILNGHTTNRIGTSLIFKIVKTGVKTTALYAKSMVIENGNFKTYSGVTGIAFSDIHFTVPIWHA